ncbi:CobW family GTP-binding protein [Eubacteriales bacterium KG127]
MTKIDIFSGFLGAGKTTLIRKLVEEAYIGEKIVLIENEFGEIGIDGGFLKESGIEINEMNSGCICCTLVGDFSKSITQVIEKFSPDRILIEPSGVGKLSDVIKAVEDLKDDRLKLNSFTTIVDGRRCKMYIKNFGEFYNNQVSKAKTVVFSHTQDMSDDEIDDAVSTIKNLNPKASFITTDWDDLDGKLILHTMENENSMNVYVDSVADDVYNHEHHCHHGNHEEMHDCCGHHEHNEHQHGKEYNCCGYHSHHEHHHADEIFDSVGIENSKSYKEDDLVDILNILDGSDSIGTVLRAKGIVKGEDGWLHFDFVPGDFEIRKGSSEVIGRIVVIGTNLNKSKIESLFF